MAHLAILIIRHQWRHRNDANSTTRRHARSLIRTHVELLRRWRRQGNGPGTD